jgi:hypothetical protein
MNSKKAKALRGLVKNLVKQGVVKADREYGYIDHTQKMSFINPETGKKEEHDHVTRTKVLNPSCARGIYKRMKKHGPMAVQVEQFNEKDQAF